MLLRIVMTLLSVGLACAARAAPVGGSCLTAQERAQIASRLALASDAGEFPSDALDDATLVASVMRDSNIELGQRIRPSTVDRLWSIEPPRRDVRAELHAARANGTLLSWLQSLGPKAPRYQALQSARCRYTLIVDNGGWRPLPPGPPLRRGVSGESVAALRVRLALEGHAAIALDPSGQVFDESLEKALAEFQTLHGLEPDGVLGRETRRALDVPAEQRLFQIEANLERWRWLPDMPADRLEVDVGGAEAILYEGGVRRLAMRVVVGDERHKTPMFTSRLEGVVFNPPWNVPASIAAKEILPKAAAQPGYLARNGFRFVGGALQQRPGPGNALGRIKFDLPSPFGVYLHDTPGRAAFARSDRALSHGCIRLEKPRELAAALLVAQGWTPSRIDAVIDAGDTVRTPLRRGVPLYVLYWTATAEPGGAVRFRPDIYGWDAKLLRALADAEAVATDFVEPADSECAAALSPQPVL